MRSKPEHDQERRKNRGSQKQQHIEQARGPQERQDRKQDSGAQMRQDRKQDGRARGRRGLARVTGDLVLAACLNILLLSLLLLLMHPYFETNDDTALLTLVNGAKRTSDPHMVIAGIFMGKLLMALYSLTHRLPWYTLVQYTMLFISFTGVTYVMIRKLGRVWGTVLSAVLVWIFGYESYIVIQFSRTAGIASASAMFLLFYALSPVTDAAGERTADTTGDRAADTVRNHAVDMAGDCAADITGKRVADTAGGYAADSMADHAAADTNMPADRNTKRAGRDTRRTGCHLGALAAGVLLSLPASWLRFTQFLPCALLTSGIGIYMLAGMHDRSGRSAFSRESKKRQRLSGIVKLLLPFAATALLCFGCRLIDIHSYESDPVWKEFRTFDALREELYDYGFPDYPSNLEVYREAGITDAGYTLYRDWNFTDPERFTPQVLQKLIDIKPERPFTKAVIKGFLRKVPARLIQRPVVWFLLVLAGMYLAGGKADKRGIFSLLWGGCLFALLYLYLYYQGRYFRPRVDTPLTYALCLTVLWQLRAEGVRRTWWAAPALAAVLIAVPSLRSRYHFRAEAQEKTAQMQKDRADFERLLEDKEHLYVIKMKARTAHQCYGPFDVMPEGLLDNVVYFGGWSAYTRAFKDTLHAFGVTNPYRDLVGNDRIYLVDDDPNLTLRYIQENYAPEASWERVEDKQLPRFGERYEIYHIRG